MARVTAVFDDQARAEGAVTELRRLGVTDTDLSFVARNEEEAVAAGASADTAGKRAAKGAAAGAGAAYSSGWQLSRSQGWGRLSPQGLSLPLSGPPVVRWPRAQSWVAPRVLLLAG